MMPRPGLCIAYTDAEITSSPTLEFQRRVYSARHRYVTKRQRPPEIAKDLGITRDQIHSWVKHYGWRQERVMRTLRKEEIAGDAALYSEHAAKLQAEQIYSATIDVIEEQIEEAREGIRDLKPKDIQALLNTVDTALQARTALFRDDTQKAPNIKPALLEAITAMSKIAFEADRQPETTFACADAEFD